MILEFPLDKARMPRKKQEIEGDPGTVKRQFWLPQDVSDALAAHAKAQNRSETQQLRTILEMLYDIRQPDTVTDITKIQTVKEKSKVEDVPLRKAG